MLPWFKKNCKFAQTEQAVETIPETTQKTPPKPRFKLNPAKSFTLPVGTTLFHGSIEDFEESKLSTGSYDKILWTTDDKWGPAMAQSYIPQSHGTIYTSPGYIRQPSQDPTIQNIQKYLGIYYDYQTKGKVEFDNTGRPHSWAMPKKKDGSTWGFEELSSAKVDQLLKEKGWQPKNKDTDPEYAGYEILTKGFEPLPPGETTTGRLFILKSTQPLKIYDYAGGKEGDLMDVDYHKIDLFRLVEKAGYDGIKINDFAQLHEWGNVGHQAIGIFKKSIPKLKWETIPAKHPTMKTLQDTTPEWEEYKARQKQASWIKSICKFSQQQKLLDFDPPESFSGDIEAHPELKKKITETTPEGAMEEEYMDGFYHVTTNLPAVLQWGALKSRKQLGGDIPGLGGGEKNEAWDKISLTHNLDKANTIFYGLLYAAKICSNQLTTSHIFGSTLSEYSFPDDFLMESDVKDFLENWMTPEEMGEDGENIDQLLDQRIKTPKEKYDFLTRLEAVLNTQMENYDMSFTGPPVGLTVPFETFCQLNPKNIAILKMQVRKGASYQHVPQELELRLDPDDVRLADNAVVQRA